MIVELILTIDTRALPPFTVAQVASWFIDQYDAAPDPRADDEMTPGWAAEQVERVALDILGAELGESQWTADWQVACHVRVVGPAPRRLWDLAEGDWVMWRDHQGELNVSQPGVRVFELLEGFDLLYRGQQEPDPGAGQLDTPIPPDRTR